MTLDGLLKSSLHVYSLWRIKAVATEPLRLREHDIRIKHDHCILLLDHSIFAL